MILRPHVLLLTLGAGCSEYGYTQATIVDFFQQNRRNTVDVLLVVDNSCSMIEEQDKLAVNFQSFIQFFDGIDVDYQIAVVTTDTVQEQFQGHMVGGDDELVLEDAAGTEIDRVAYDRSWPWLEGASIALDPGSVSRSENDQPEAWCLSTTSFGDGDLGTPGAPNPECPTFATTTGSGTTGTGTTGTGTTGTGTGTGGATVSPGDVIFTELMPDPAAVDDSLGEWVELINLTDRELDLSGWVVRDDGRNHSTLPAGSRIEAGGLLVVARSGSAAENGGLTDAVGVSGFSLNDRVTLITPATQNPEDVFSEMVAQGTSGSGIEMGLEAARMALSEPLLSTENAGFLREEANLSLIFLSDEEDSSPDPVDGYLRFFTDLKGEEAYRDHGIMQVSAVVGKDPPEFSGEPSCTSIHGLATYGSRYVDMAQRTEGQLESICDEDFSTIAARLGLTLSGLLLEFELSDYPDTDTLRVALYETADDASFIRDLQRGVDYEYDLGNNSIRFEETQIPPAQAFIRVEYNPLATGAVESTAP